MCCTDSFSNLINFLQFLKTEDNLRNLVYSDETSTPSSENARSRWDDKNGMWFAEFILSLANISPTFLGHFP